MQQQNWKKIGQLFNPDSYGYSYAAVPVVAAIHGPVLNILFTSRDHTGRSYISALDYDLKAQSIINADTGCRLTHGKPGEFDEDGVMASDCFEIGHRKFVTYIGWNRAISVPFRNAVGLAELTDTGLVRCFNGPILDRSMYDPCFVASNCVIKVPGGYKMFYLSCEKWDIVQDKLQHFYNIKCARSDNGFVWYPTGNVAIGFKYPNEYAISVPRVLCENGVYKMWYSYRAGPLSDAYRIGYAESVDSEHWTRMDEAVQLFPSDKGWDSEMLCYPYIFDFEGQRYMLYNGNAYGKTGFGIAILEI